MLLCVLFQTLILSFMTPLFGQACVDNSFALMMIRPICLGWTNAACLYHIMAIYSYVCSCEAAF